MRITDCQVFPYALPFRRPFATAAGTWQARHGAAVRLSTDAGPAGLGDLAPLPPSPGEVHRGVQALVAFAAELAGLAPTKAMRELDRCDSLPSPARAALESALLDLQAQDEEVPLCRLLVPGPLPSVAVNAVIAASDIEASVQHALRAKGDGFGCIKLKVGTRDDIARVRAVREAVGPGTLIRLDANGAWRRDEAIAMLRQLRECDIEFVEQPVPPGRDGDLRAVREAAGVPVAADEDVTSPARATELLQAEAVDALVLKLPVLGGLRPALEVAQLASVAGVRAIVTSAIESGIGVAAAMHLAAALPSPSTACGLATLDLLADDLICETLPFAGGRMAVPAGAGLGVTLDSDALQRFAGEESA